MNGAAVHLSVHPSASFRHRSYMTLDCFFSERIYYNILKVAIASKFSLEFITGAVLPILNVTEHLFNQPLPSFRSLLN